jgi:hypothetical protein
MYGCTVLTNLADTSLRDYEIGKIFRLLHINIIIYQLQGNLFELLANVGVFQSDTLLDAKTKANGA